jgi:hypothetical protein
MIELSRDVNFRSLVQAAITDKALAVMSEPEPEVMPSDRATKRGILAGYVLAAPANEVERFSIAVAVRTPETATSQELPSDSDIADILNDIWNSVAGVKEWDI